MENQSIQVVFKNKNGNKSLAEIENDTIRFRGVKLSLAELDELFSAFTAKEYSHVVNNFYLKCAQLTSVAINNGNGDLQGIVPTSNDYYCIKVLAESLAEMQVE